MLQKREVRECYKVKFEEQKWKILVFAIIIW